MSNLAIFSDLPQGQAEIDRFSDIVIREVKEGNANPLQIHIALKAIAKAGERISKEIAQNIKTERGLYHEQNLSIYGAEISGIVPVSTTYDYSVCGDPELTILQAAFDKAETELKARQQFLKNLSKPETILDRDTGEYYTVNPPIKKQTDGIKISFK